MSIERRQRERLAELARLFVEGSLEGLHDQVDGIENRSGDHIGDVDVYDLFQGLPVDADVPQPDKEYVNANELRDAIREEARRARGAWKSAHP